MQEPPAKLDLDRVLVVGISCSGKTIFSKRLAIVLSNPRFELDDFFGGRTGGRNRRPSFAAARRRRRLANAG